MTNTNKSRKTRKTTIAAILGASIVREGEFSQGDRKGQKGVVLRFADGTEGALPKDYVMKLAHEQAEDSRAILRGLGFKPDGLAVIAGVFSSVEWRHADGRSVTLETAKMGRLPAEIARELLEKAQGAR